jgi:hypothetical protein
MQRALQSCGGEAPLAKAFGVTVGELSLWLRGHEPMPAGIYWKALGIIGGKRGKAGAR